MGLIEREAVTDRYYAEWESANITTDKQDFAWLKRCLEEAPTVEAEPVRHGKWIDKKRHVDDAFGGYDYRICVCSECQNEKRYYTNYCPNCGAKMDGDKQ